MIRFYWYISLLLIGIISVFSYSATGLTISKPTSTLEAICVRSRPCYLYRLLSLIIEQPTYSNQIIKYLSIISRDGSFVVEKGSNESCPMKDFNVINMTSELNFSFYEFQNEENCFNKIKYMPSNIGTFEFEDDLTITLTTQTRKYRHGYSHVKKNPIVFHTFYTRLLVLEECDYINLFSMKTVQVIFDSNFQKFLPRLQRKCVSGFDIDGDILISFELSQYAGSLRISSYPHVLQFNSEDLSHVGTSILGATSTIDIDESLLRGTSKISFPLKFFQIDGRSSNFISDSNFENALILSDFSSDLLSNIELSLNTSHFTSCGAKDDFFQGLNVSSQDSSAFIKIELFRMLTDVKQLLNSTLLKLVPSINHLIELTNFVVSKDTSKKSVLIKSEDAEKFESPRVSTNFALEYDKRIFNKIFCNFESDTVSIYQYSETLLPCNILHFKIDSKSSQLYVASIKAIKGYVNLINTDVKVLSENYSSISIMGRLIAISGALKTIRYTSGVDSDVVSVSINILEDDLNKKYFLESIDSLSTNISIQVLPKLEVYFTQTRIILCQKGSNFYSTQKSVSQGMKTFNQSNEISTKTCKQIQNGQTETAESHRFEYILLSTVLQIVSTSVLDSSQIFNMHLTVDNGFFLRIGNNSYFEAMNTSSLDDMLPKYNNLLQREYNYSGLLYELEYEISNVLLIPNAKNEKKVRLLAVLNYNDQSSYYNINIERCCEPLFIRFNNNIINNTIDSNQFGHVKLSGVELAVSNDIDEVTLVLSFNSSKAIIRVPALYETSDNIYIPVCRDCDYLENADVTSYDYWSYRRGDLKLNKSSLAFEDALLKDSLRETQHELDDNESRYLSTTLINGNIYKGIESFTVSGSPTLINAVLKYLKIFTSSSCLVSLRATSRCLPSVASLDLNIELETLQSKVFPSEEQVQLERLSGQMSSLIIVDPVLYMSTLVFESFELCIRISKEVTRLELSCDYGVLNIVQSVKGVYKTDKCSVELLGSSVSIIAGLSVLSYRSLSNVAFVSMTVRAFSDYSVSVREIIIVNSGELSSTAKQDKSLIKVNQGGISVVVTKLKQFNFFMVDFLPSLLNVTGSICCELGEISIVNASKVTAWHNGNRNISFTCPTENIHSFFQSIVYKPPRLYSGVDIVGLSMSMISIDSRIIQDYKNVSVYVDTPSEIITECSDDFIAKKLSFNLSEICNITILTKGRKLLNSVSLVYINVLISDGRLMISKLPNLKTKKISLNSTEISLEVDVEFSSRVFQYIGIEFPQFFSGIAKFRILVELIETGASVKSSRDIKIEVDSVEMPLQFSTDLDNANFDNSSVSISENVNFLKLDFLSVVNIGKNSNDLWVDLHMSASRGNVVFVPENKPSMPNFITMNDGWVMLANKMNESANKSININFSEAWIVDNGVTSGSVEIASSDTSSIVNILRSGMVRYLPPLMRSAQDKINVQLKCWKFLPSLTRLASNWTVSKTINVFFKFNTNVFISFKRNPVVGKEDEILSLRDIVRIVDSSESHYSSNHHRYSVAIASKHGRISLTNNSSYLKYSQDVRAGELNLVGDINILRKALGDVVFQPTPNMAFECTIIFQLASSDDLVWQSFYLKVFLEPVSDCPLLRVHNPVEINGDLVYTKLTEFGVTIENIDAKYAPPFLLPYLGSVDFSVSSTKVCFFVNYYSYQQSKHLFPSLSISKSNPCFNGGVSQNSLGFRSISIQGYDRGIMHALDSLFFVVNDFENVEINMTASNTYSHSRTSVVVTANINRTASRQLESLGSRDLENVYSFSSSARSKNLLNATSYPTWVSASFNVVMRQRQLQPVREALSEDSLSLRSPYITLSTMSEKELNDRMRKNSQSLILNNRSLSYKQSVQGLSDMGLSEISNDSFISSDEPIPINLCINHLPCSYESACQLKIKLSCSGCFLIRSNISYAELVFNGIANEINEFIEGLSIKSDSMSDRASLTGYIATNDMIIHNETKIPIILRYRARKRSQPPFMNTSADPWPVVIINVTRESQLFKNGMIYDSDATAAEQFVFMLSCSICKFSFLTMNDSLVYPLLVFVSNNGSSLEISSPYVDINMHLRRVQYIVKGYHYNIDLIKILLKDSNLNEAVYHLPVKILLALPGLQINVDANMLKYDKPTFMLNDSVVSFLNCDSESLLELYLESSLRMPNRSSTAHTLSNINLEEDNEEYGFRLFKPVSGLIKANKEPLVSFNTDNNFEAEKVAPSKAIRLIGTKDVLLKAVANIIVEVPKYNTRVLDISLTLSYSSVASVSSSSIISAYFQTDRPNSVSWGSQELTSHEAVVELNEDSILRLGLSLPITAMGELIGFESQTRTPQQASIYSSGFIVSSLSAECTLSLAANKGYFLNDSQLKHQFTCENYSVQSIVLTGNSDSINLQLQAIFYSNCAKCKGSDVISAYLSCGDDNSSFNVTIFTKPIPRFRSVSIFSERVLILQGERKTPVFETRDGNPLVIGEKISIFDPGLSSSKCSNSSINSDIKFPISQIFTFEMTSRHGAFSSSILSNVNFSCSKSSIICSRNNFGKSYKFDCCQNIILLGEVSNVEKVIQNIVYYPPPLWVGVDEISIIAYDFGLNKEKVPDEMIESVFVLSLFPWKNPSLHFPVDFLVSFEDKSAAIAPSLRDESLLVQYQNFNQTPTNLNDSESFLIYKRDSSRYLNYTTLQKLLNIKSEEFENPFSRSDGIYVVCMNVSFGSLSIEREQFNEQDYFDQSHLNGKNLALKGSFVEINEKLRSLSYIPDANWNSKLSITSDVQFDTLAFSITGPAGNTSKSSVDIFVWPINDPPVIGLSELALHDDLYFEEDQLSRVTISTISLVCSQNEPCFFGGLGVRIRDVDASIDGNSGYILISFSVSKGTIIFNHDSKNSAFTFYSDPKSNIVSTKVLLSEIEAVFQLIGFQPCSNQIGEDILEITANDLGNYGFCQNSSTFPSVNDFSKLNNCPRITTFQIPIAIRQKDYGVGIIIPSSVMQTHKNEALAIKGITFMELLKSKYMDFIALNDDLGSCLKSNNNNSDIFYFRIATTFGTLSLPYSFETSDKFIGVPEIKLSGTLFSLSNSIQEIVFTPFNDLRITISDFATISLELYRKLNLIAKEEIAVYIFDALDQPQIILPLNVSIYQYSYWKITDVFIELSKVPDANRRKSLLIEISCLHGTFSVDSSRVSDFISFSTETNSSILLSFVSETINAQLANIYYIPNPTFYGTDRVTIAILKISDFNEAVSENNIYSSLEYRPTMTLVSNSLDVFVNIKIQPMIKIKDALETNQDVVLSLKSKIEVLGDVTNLLMWYLTLQVEHGTINFIDSNTYLDNMCDTSFKAVKCMGNISSLNLAIDHLKYIPKRSWNSQISGKVDLLKVALIEIENQRISPFLAAHEEFPIIVFPSAIIRPFIQLPKAEYNEEQCGDGDLSENVGFYSSSIPICSSLITVDTLHVSALNCLHIENVKLSKDEIYVPDLLFTLEIEVDHGQVTVSPLINASSICMIFSHEFQSKIELYGTGLVINNNLLNLIYLAPSNYIGHASISFHLSYISPSNQYVKQTVALPIYVNSDLDSVSIIRPDALLRTLEDSKLRIKGLRIEDRSRSHQSVLLLSIRVDYGAITSMHIFENQSQILIDSFSTYNEINPGPILWYREINIKGSMESINSVLDSLIYEPKLNWNSDFSFEFDSINVRILKNTCEAHGLIQVIVDSVNDAPVIEYNSQNTIFSKNIVTGDELSYEIEQISPIITSAGSCFNVQGMSVRDVDAYPEKFITLIVKSSFGKISLSRTSSAQSFQNVLFIKGNGVNNSEIVVEASISTVNNLLMSLSVCVNRTIAGINQILLTVNDMGNSGLGGAKITELQLPFFVKSRNFPPIIETPKHFGIDNFNLDQGSFIPIKGALNEFEYETESAYDNISFELWTIDVLSYAKSNGSVHQTNTKLDSRAINLMKVDHIFNPRYFTKFGNDIYFQANSDIGAELWFTSTIRSLISPTTAFSQDYFAGEYASSSSLFFDTEFGKQSSKPAPLFSTEKYLLFSANELDLSWRQDADHKDFCESFRKSSFRSNVYYAISESTVWEPERKYDCPRGFKWASTKEAVELFPDSLRVAYSAITSFPKTYQDQCGWDGLKWGGKERRFFRFSDSSITMAYKDAAKPDLYPIEFDYEGLRSNFAGIVCLIDSENSTSVDLKSRLWRTDGTTSGTTRIENKLYDSRHFISFGGFVYFSAASDMEGRELWRSDSSFGGAELVSRSSSDKGGLIPGEKGSNPKDLVTVGGSLVFSAETERNGRELYILRPKTDAYDVNSVSVEYLDVASGTISSNPSEFESFGGRFPLIFKATTPNFGYELWITNGTKESTFMLLDICKGEGSSNPKHLTWYKDRIFFQADDCFHGVEMWVTDGTSSGTKLFLDINRGSSSGCPSFFTPFTSFKYPIILFFAFDSAFKSDVKCDDRYLENSAQLWMSDGTQSGTHRLFDQTANDFIIDTSSLNEMHPARIFNSNGFLFLAAKLRPYKAKSPILKQERIKNQALVIKDEGSYYSRNVSVTLLADNGYLVLGENELRTENDENYILFLDPKPNLNPYLPVLISKMYRVDLVDSMTTCERNLESFKYDAMIISCLDQEYFNCSQIIERTRNFPSIKCIVLYSNERGNLIRDVSEYSKSCYALSTPVIKSQSRPLKDSLSSFESVIRKVINYNLNDRSIRISVSMRPLLTSDVADSLPSLLVGSNITLLGSVHRINTALEKMYFYSSFYGNAKIQISVTNGLAPKCSVIPNYVLRNTPGSFQASISSRESCDFTSYTVEESINLFISSINQSPSIHSDSLNFSVSLNSQALVPKIVIGDPDIESSKLTSELANFVNTSPPLSVIISCRLGRLSLPRSEGIVLLQGRGLNDRLLSMRGALTNINKSLSSLLYSCLIQDGCHHGALDELRIEVNDEGFIGRGGPLTKDIALDVNVI